MSASPDFGSGLQEHISLQGSGLGEAMGKIVPLITRQIRQNSEIPSMPRNEVYTPIAAFLQDLSQHPDQFQLVGLTKDGDKEHPHASLLIQRVGGSQDTDTLLLDYDREYNVSGDKGGETFSFSLPRYNGDFALEIQVARKYRYIPSTSHEFPTYQDITGAGGDPIFEYYQGGRIRTAANMGLRHGSGIDFVSTIYDIENWEHDTSPFKPLGIAAASIAGVERHYFS